jgi:hypothetical protein
MLLTHVSDPPKHGEDHNQHTHIWMLNNHDNDDGGDPKGHTADAPRVMLYRGAGTSSRHATRTRRRRTAPTTPPGPRSHRARPPT